MNGSMQLNLNKHMFWMRTLELCVCHWCWHISQTETKFSVIKRAGEWTD